MRSRFNNMGAVGVITDRPPWDLPQEAWTYAENVRFTNGAVRSINGTAALSGTPPDSAYRLLFHRAANGTPLWFFGSEDKLWAFTGGSYQDVTNPLTVYDSVFSQWRACAFNDHAIFNYRSKPPQSYKIGSSSTFEDLANWSVSLVAAELIRPFKNYLFALRVDEIGQPRNRQLLVHSNGAQPNSLPTSWDYTDPNEDTGRVEFGQSSDLLVDAIPLRDLLVIYKDNHTWVAQNNYGSVDNPFTYRQAFSQVGLISPHCASAVKGQHVVWSYDDVVVHDLNNAQSLLNNRTRRYFYNDINQNYYDRCYVVPNHNEYEMYFCYPSSGAQYPNKALVWNWEENTVSFKDLGGEIAHIEFGEIIETPFVLTTQIDDIPGSIDSKRESIDALSTAPDFKINKLLYARPNYNTQIPNAPNLEVEDEAYGTFADGKSINQVVIREALPFDDFLRQKRVHRVFPKVVGAAGETLKISIGTRQTFEDPVSFSSQEDYVIGTDIFTSFRETGRIIDIKFDFNSTKKLTLHGFDIEWEPAGLY